MFLPLALPVVLLLLLLLRTGPRAAEVVLECCQELQHRSIRQTRWRGTKAQSWIRRSRDCQPCGGRGSCGGGREWGSIRGHCARCATWSDRRRPTDRRRCRRRQRRCQHHPRRYGSGQQRGDWCGEIHKTELPRPCNVDASLGDCASQCCHCEAFAAHAIYFHGQGSPHAAGRDCHPLHCYVVYASWSMASGRPRPDKATMTGHQSHNSEIEASVVPSTRIA